MRPGTRRYVQGGEEYVFQLSIATFDICPVISEWGGSIFGGVILGGGRSRLVRLHLYPPDSMSTFVECIIITTTRFVLCHVNDPLAFGFQASTPFETFPDFEFSRA